MTEQKATNVHWHEGLVTREDRHQLLGQKGATIWFTGLSASGKSTIKRLEARRHKANIELDRQLQRVHGLRREVDSLARDSLARERLAREELGYTRRGEMIFLLAEPPENPTKTTP